MEWRSHTPVKPIATLTEFLELRENKVIKETDSMGQGHHIFRGPVTIYSISPQE
jgi:hypothetical protein